MKAKRALTVCLGVLLVALVIFFIAWLYPTSPSKFNFLKGQPLVESGLLPGIEDGSQFSNRPSEYRIYCWKEDFDSVAGRIDPELKLLGYHIVDQSNTEIEWQNTSGEIVAIRAERKAGNSGLNRFEKIDTHWVTVYEFKMVDDNFVTKFKLLINKNP